MPCEISQTGSTGDAGIFSLNGRLDFFSVKLLNEKALVQFNEYKTIKVDLSGINYVNSAGLALLLEWKRWALQSDRKIEIIHIPEKLINIARICEVDSILLG